MHAPLKITKWFSIESILKPPHSKVVPWKRLRKWFGNMLKSYITKTNRKISHLERAINHSYFSSSLNYCSATNQLMWQDCWRPSSVSMLIKVMKAEINISKLLTKWNEDFTTMLISLNQLAWSIQKHCKLTNNIRSCISSEKGLRGLQKLLVILSKKRWIGLHNYRIGVSLFPKRTEFSWRKLKKTNKERWNRKRKYTCQLEFTRSRQTMA